jgi:hypothetical protein
VSWGLSLGGPWGINHPATDPRQAMELLPKLEEEEAGAELGGREGIIAAAFGQVLWGGGAAAPWCQPICLLAHLAAHIEVLHKVSCMALSLFGARHFPGSLAFPGCTACGCSRPGHKLTVDRCVLELPLCLSWQHLVLSGQLRLVWRGPVTRKCKM